MATGYIPSLKTLQSRSIVHPQFSPPIAGKTTYPMTTDELKVIGEGCPDPGSPLLLPYHHLSGRGLIVPPRRERLGAQVPSLSESRTS